MSLVATLISHPASAPSTATLVDGARDSAASNGTAHWLADGIAAESG